MQRQCRITVLETKCFADLQERCLADPRSDPCPFFKPGDTFLLKRTPQQDDFYHLMNGKFCGEAWDAGSRISNVTLPDGTPLDMDGMYDVATNNYRANSHLLTCGEIYAEEDGLPELLEIDVRGDLGGIRELIGDYIVNVLGVRGDDGKVTFTVEDVTEENANWKLTGYSWDEEKHARVAELVEAGTLTRFSSEDGRTTNVKSITEADLAAA